MTELNPNHPMTRAVGNQWHKLTALLMLKYGTDHVVITEDDIVNMPKDTAITIEERSDGIHLRIVDAETAALLARKEGGLPA